MAFLRAVSGTLKTKFPWDAYNNGTWNTKSVTVSYGTPQYITCITSSPEIVSGTSLVATLTGSNLNRLALVAQVSLDGSTWSNIGTISYQSSVTFTINLNAYVGSKIYIRFKVENGYQSGTGTATLNTCIMDN